MILCAIKNFLIFYNNVTPLGFAFVIIFFKFVGCSVLTTPFCLGRRLVCVVEIASSYLLAMTKGIRFVGWISAAHPPLKPTTVIVYRAKKTLRYSARSEKTLRYSARSEKTPASFCTERSEVAESPKYQTKKFSSEPKKRFCDCAQNDIGC